MKQILSVLIALLIFIPSLSAKAHTGLQTSIPEEGAILKTPLEEIVLTFETEIESLSTMNLYNQDQEEIPLNNLSIEENAIRASVGEVLERGSYFIQWKIVGKDGHTIEGKVSFQTQIEDSPPDEQKDKEEDAGINQSAKEEGTKVESESNGEENSFFSVLIIVLAIVLIASFIFLRRKNG